MTETVDISELVKDYALHPINNYEMDNFTISHEEGNPICGDNIIIYLQISSDKIIEKYSFVGNTSTVTTAAASIVAELIEHQLISEVLLRNYQFLVDKGFVVSAKRKRAALLPILTVRNALHKYLGDRIEETFDDLDS